MWSKFALQAPKCLILAMLACFCCNSKCQRISVSVTCFISNYFNQRLLYENVVKVCYFFLGIDHELTCFVKSAYVF